MGVRCPCGGMESPVKSNSLRKTCIRAREARQKREPLLPKPLPEYHWQMVATDIFELGGKQYLLVVNYFSRFPEVINYSLLLPVVISLLKSVIVQHGIPELVQSDNGPQYACK